MVGRLFPLARHPVDDAGAAARYQGWREQNMVDAQALVQAKAQLAVIPPAERFVRLLEQAEGVGQADVEQALQGGAFLVRHQYLAGPGDGVIDRKSTRLN